MSEIERLKIVRLWDHKQQAWVDVQVDVSIDLNVVANRLAAKAQRNKSRCSTGMDGAIKVTLR